jgi:UDP:flavonoid glycosyltransferase YjiC (YdhE family)
VTVQQSAPHSIVLQHASAVVTHGGHGTVARALAAGVPVVALPHGRDQADNAVRVEARGAGIAIKKSASPARIARAVADLLGDDAHAAAAARLGEALRHDAASGLLLRELESVGTDGERRPITTGCA